jgi:RNA polymerase sigma-70 factor (ECF subfamily)
LNVLKPEATHCCRTSRMIESAEALKKGDREAFLRLASRYGARLHNAALALCRDHSDAQDLVQETFAEALRSAARFEGRSAPYTWLYGIMRRRFLQRCRKNRRFLRLIPVIGREAMTSQLEEIDDDGQSTDPLLAIVMRLPVKQREILYLRYVEGRRITEISVLTGVAEGTVKSRLHHALRRLRAIIESDADLSGVPSVERANEL